MKYLLALGFLGMASANTYVRINSGLCEDAGYEPIMDATECETEGIALAHPNGIAGTYQGTSQSYQYALGCFQSEIHSKIYLKPDYTPNSDESAENPPSDCGHGSYECICRVPAAAGGCPSPAPSNPIDYINDQCCDCA